MLGICTGAEIVFLIFSASNSHDGFVGLVGCGLRCLGISFRKCPLLIRHDWHLEGQSLGILEEDISRNEV